MNTIKHTDAREIGAEWVCLQAIRELEIDKFLWKEGWSEIQINTTLAHLITRTIYSPSELKSMRIMDENSAVCELISGNQEWRPGFQSIFKVAPSLYELTDLNLRPIHHKKDDRSDAHLFLGLLSYYWLLKAEWIDNGTNKLGHLLVGNSQ